MTFDRRHGIGGSDVPAILGVSPWRDRTDVWMEKTSHPAWRPKAVTPEMRWGTLLEPVLRQAYEQDTGRKVHAPGDKTYWAEDHIRYAHLDGLIEGEGIWEAKVPFQTFRLWQDEPPVFVLAQVQHYMDVTGEPWCDVSALMPGADFQTYRVPADPEAQASIRIALTEFWDHVQRGEPPDPLPVAVEYPRSKSDFTLVADDEAEELVRIIRAMKYRQADTEENVEEAKEALKRKIGNAAGMIGNGWRIRFKSNKDGINTDWKLVAATYRAIIDTVRNADDIDEVRRFLTDYKPDVIMGLYTTVKPGARPFVLEETNQ